MTEMTTQEKIRILQNDFPLWARNFVKIRAKEGGEPQSFVLKPAQVKLHNFIESIRAQKEPVRVCVPKARQLGVSTYVAGRYLHRASLNRGIPVFILSHLSDSTDYLFKMVKRMYNSLPAQLQPSVSASNRKELRFGALDSEYALGTAGSEEIGRGTTPLLLHLSEAAFYSKTDALVTGLMQGVPAVPESEIIIESTANGINNLFYNLCMKGADPSSVSRYRTYFLPWFYDPDYTEKIVKNFTPNNDEKDMMETYDLTVNQIFWRRRKLEDEFNGDLWKFKQEYPMYLSEAFVASGDRLIQAKHIEAARKRKPVFDDFSPRVLGVDGAGGAKDADRTVLVLRQGRNILWHKVFTEMNPMRLAGIIAKDIDDWGIDMAFVDVAYGDGAVSRLQEMGYKQCVQSIHFGMTALDPEVYFNKRAQMYGYLKEWFEEGDAVIPNSEDFVTDLLMIPGFKQSGSRGKLKLPSKEEIKADNSGDSPDISDATALTFAFPVRSKHRYKERRTTDIQIARALSPFQTRKSATVQIDRGKPSELYVDRRVG